MNTRAVTVTLPEWVWGRLATVAERFGVTVDDLVSMGVRGVLDHPAVAADRMGTLYAELNDARRGGYRAPRKGNAA